MGFSGRVLDPEIKEAKYINSPETLLYHKSQMLYGYSELYQEIRKKKEIIVVEGEFDVISSAQAHVNHVVAIKGSALTQQHLQLISRVADKVLFSLDMDDAGVTATKRAITLAQDLPLEMRVVAIPSGKDPDELARKEPTEWRNAVKTSISVYEYLLQAALRQHDPATPEGKRKIVDQLAPIFGTISHAVEQDVYLKKLATALDVREELVRQDINRFKQPKNAQTPKPAKTAVKPPEQLDHQAKLEIYLLYLLFTAPSTEIVGMARELKDSNWTMMGVKPLVELIASQEANFKLTDLIKQLPEDLRQLYFELSTNPEFEYVVGIDRQSEWQKTVHNLQEEVIQEQLEKINLQLEQLDTLTKLTPEQEADQNRLLAEIVKLRQTTTFKKQD